MKELLEIVEHAPEIRAVLVACVKILNDKELLTEVAQGLAQLRASLVAEGFSNDEAMEIVLAISGRLGAKK